MENSTEPTGSKPLAQPSTAGSTQLKKRMEWSHLLTSSTGTMVTPSGDDRLDPVSRAVKGPAHQVMKNSNGEGGTTLRFDLGSEGEGGRKAWYVPNERTVFPVKKGVGYPPREKQKHEVEDVEGQGKTSVPAKEVVSEEGGDDVLWGVTEEEVERAMRGERPLSGGYTPPRLRRHRSLEEDVRGIEDEESRRLTAIAYLT